jgi:hypothetical protein
MIWLLMAGMAVLEAQDLPLVFLFPEDLGDAQGVRLEPQMPERGLTLAEQDVQRPKLWYGPAAARATADGAMIWYQRVNSGEADYLDQRTFCLGEIRGAQWVLPELNPTVPPWGGPNNVCLRRSPYKPTWGGFNVFQIVEIGGVYQMLYWDQPTETGEAGAMLATSKDGRVWEKDPGGAVFTEHNDAFTLLRKDGESLLYQTALEDWPDKPYPDNLDKNRRVQSLRTSKDLHAWTAQEVFLRPDSEDRPETEFYLMKAFPYGHRFLGLLMKYFADPKLPHQHSAIMKYEVIVSEDARHWRRPFRDVDVGFWSYADPFPYRGKLHFVTWKDSGMRTVCYQPNRMIAVVAEEEEGVFITRPFPLPATGLALDADTRNGWIEVELLGAAGQPVEGFARSRIQGIDGDQVEIPWDKSALRVGQAHRLRVRLHHAKLFAITAAER